MTHSSNSNRRYSALISQGDRLNKAAAKGTGNLNESYLLVHGVMARALAVGAPCDADLDSALSRSLANWRESRAFVA